MQLFINNKVFTGIFDGNNKSINIPLTQKEDILYFYKIEPKLNRYNKKSDFIQDIQFKGGYVYGTLFNCWFLLSENEDYVTLHYDWKTTLLDFDV